MIQNYFKIAWRNLRHNKLHVAINVLGLSIGISAAIVIFLIVYFEFSFDKFEKDGDRIYRVVLDLNSRGFTGHSVGVPAPLANAISNEIAGVEEVVPVFIFQGDATAKVSIEDDNSRNPKVYKKQKDIVCTDNRYLHLLDYQWIAGDRTRPLQDPFVIILTESRAKQYFPQISSEDIIGKQITYNDITLTVSGIVKDLNQRTDFTAAEFISLSTIEASHLKDDFMMDRWSDRTAYSNLYLKLSKEDTKDKIETSVNNLYGRHYKEAANKITLRLQPLHDIHFNAKYESFNTRIADKTTMYGLLTVAVFLLLLASINFINLSTAQASQRTKEIGIRKTIGCSKGQLIGQFLCETLFITSIATLLSVIIAPFLLKLFADFIPVGLDSYLLYRPEVLLFLLLLTITVSFLSGIYPAFVLSRFKPVSVLKNQTSISTRQPRQTQIRKILTVSQFVVAQFFIIATIIVSKQVNYSINTDMGFNKDAVVNFDLPRDFKESQRTTLLNEMKSIPGVELASTGFFAPADKGVAVTIVEYNDGEEEKKPNAQIRWGDANYLNVYQIKLLVGRNVLPSDSIKEFLINESYAKAVGFQNPKEALGKLLNWNGKDIPIVGVMKDFHDRSTKAWISPLVFGGNNGATFHVKLKSNSKEGATWRSTIANMQEAYIQIFPDEEFNYRFVDDTIAQFYEREQATAKLLGWATGLAILISCLGLLGLVIYTINNRIKEIGVRKVLGASVTQIVIILSNGFLKLVLLAFVISAPIAWWATYKWLQDFAYRTPLNGWVFLVSGMGMISIAFIVLSLQTIKAARANPVDSLRNE